MLKKERKKKEEPSIKSHPVLLNKWFSSSHRFICKQPFEKPKSPPFIFLNGWQGAFKLSTSYNTWSCKEPPILILKFLKAIIATKNAVPS
jgi:hypothetical protein